MASETVKIKQKDFCLEKAISHIKKVLNQSDDFDHVDHLPDLNNLTYSNGVYVSNTAFFIDIRDSSKHVKSNHIKVNARLYRAYISEIIMILRSHPCCKEINIVGDCVSAIFIEDKELSKKYSGDKSDVIEALQSASMIIPTVGIINKLFKNKYDNYTPIKVGIGVATGKSLVIKTGESGSGISKPVFIGDNVNLAAHLCDTAHKNNFSEILVNDDVKNNCTKCEVETENEKFSEWLTIQENVDNVPCYGGSFVRVSIQKKLDELNK
ncbi:adenylate/guanylate cyclase domain-containing protein [Lactiplantibacillus pentosus]|uniref:adenylate/guanylate cyclase domain-containing protein n=1 Tax=Lactiplantibacillus pentosus TaxID=1589 RepID=UPI00080FDF43|nr:adenylate/guanylate cyclase domain-containing protein [Lactiplantibacillus pentosus]